MFAQKNRISKQKEFENIFKNGKIIKSGFFKIVYLKNSYNYNRVAIIVSKKVNKSAVIRNKIKRIVRKELNPLLLKEYSIDIIFIVFPNFLDNKNKLTDEIKRLFVKISLP